MSIVWGKALVAVALGALAFGPPRRWLERGIAARPIGDVTAIFVLSRLGAAFLVFVVLGAPLPGDVGGYYRAFADAVLAGARHPRSPYSPGFDALLAAVRWLTGGVLGFVWLMIAAEAGAFWLVLRLVARHRPDRVPSLAALWLVSPVSVLHVALGGQDEVLILLAWSIVATLVRSGRAVAAGVGVAIGLAMTKLLGIFAALPLVGEPRRQARRAALAAAAGAAILAAGCVLIGIPLGNVAAEARLRTSGNLWTVLALATGRVPAAGGMAALALTALVLAAAIVLLHARPRSTPIDQLLRVAGVAGCVFLLVSQKSLASYLVIFLPGVLSLSLEAPALQRGFLLGLVLPVAAFEPSLWFRFGEGEALAASAAARAVMLAADLTLVAGYLLLAWRGLHGRAEDIAAFQPEPA